MAAWLALVILIVSGFVLVGRHDAIVIGGLDAADLAMTASGVLLVVWLSGTLLPQMRDSHPRAYRLIVRGGGAVALIALAAWLRGPLQEAGRFAWAQWGQTLPLPSIVNETLASWRGPPAPSPDAVPGEKAVRIRSRADGHFHASAHLNGTPATLLVDSGAAAILLKASDARDAGIDMTALSFTIPVETAQGTAYTARARLRRLSVGVIALDDVEVLVAQPGRLETSLLGVSFLSKLRSYEFSGAFLTFRG
jgi:aspartyl protease family protein